MKKIFFLFFLLFGTWVHVQSQCTLSTSKTDINCYGTNTGSVSSTLVGSVSGTSYCIPAGQSPEGCTGKVVTANIDVIAEAGERLCIQVDNFNKKIQTNTGAIIVIQGSNVKPSEIVLNGGTLIVNGSAELLNINRWNSVILQNYGTLTISTFRNGDFSDAANYGTLTVNGEFSLPNGQSFINYCTVTLKNGLNSNGNIINHHRISVVSGITNLYSGSYTSFSASEISVSNNITIQCAVRGEGNTCSLIRLTGNYTTTLYSPATFSGNIKLCDPNNVETNYTSVPASFFDCTCDLNASTISYEWKNSSNTIISTSEDVSDLSAGTYILTVHSTGCPNSPLTSSQTISEPTELFVDASESNVTCSGAGNGSITPVVSGGVEPYTYSWSNGSTQEGLENLQPGTYTLTVMDANSCPKSVTKTITQPAALSVSVTKTDVRCHGASTGSISVTPSGGILDYTLSWNNGAYTGAFLPALPAGTYNLVLTDSKGCTLPQTVTITQPSVINVSNTSLTPPACNGSPTGSIDITVSGGAGGYTYLWSNGATSQDLPTVSGGTYTVTVTDANSCSKNHSVTLTQPDPIDYTLTPTEVTSYGGNNGSATVVLNDPQANENLYADNCEVPSLPAGNECDCANPVTSNQNVTVGVGQKVCITATNYTGNIDLTGGTLVICGSAIPAVFNNISGNIIVLGSLTLTNQFEIRGSYSITNYGTLNFNSGLSALGTLINNKTCNVVTGNIEVKQGGLVYNKDVIDIKAGNMICDGPVTNSGNLIIKGSLTNQNNQTFTNNCSVTVTQSFTNNSTFVNKGQISVSSFTNVNGSGVLNIHEGSEISVTDLYLDGQINASGTGCASIKVNGGNIRINSSAKESGNFSICKTGTGTLENGSSTFTDNLNCNCNLEAPSCSVEWSTGETTESITDLTAGEYSVTITCGGCSSTVPVIIEQKATIILNTAFVNPGTFEVAAPGITALTQTSGTPASEITINPELPDEGTENTVTLNIAEATGVKPLEVKVNYNHLSTITSVQAKVENQFLNINQDYYTVDPFNKLTFYNEKPGPENLNISSNLVDGVKLDPVSKRLILSIPSNALFTATNLSINNISILPVEMVYGPSPILIWNASVADPGLYEFQLELTTSGKSKIYKGQFIIE